MANESIEVPINLITDIELNPATVSKFEHDVQKSFSGLKGSLSKVLGDVDTSQFNKKLEGAFKNVTDKYRKMDIASTKLSSATVAAGETSPKYQADITAARQRLSDLQSNWDKIRSSISGTEAEVEQKAARLFRIYGKGIADAQAQLTAIKPENYISDASIQGVIRYKAEAMKALVALKGVGSATDKMYNAISKYNKTDAFRALEKDAIKLFKQLGTLYDRFTAFKEVKPSADVFGGFIKQLAIVDVRLESVFQKMKNLSTNRKDLAVPEMSSWAENQSMLVDYETKVKDITNEIMKFAKANSSDLGVPQWGDPGAFVGKNMTDAVAKVQRLVPDIKPWNALNSAVEKTKTSVVGLLGLLAPARSDWDRMVGSATRMSVAAKEAGNNAKQISSGTDKAKKDIENTSKSASGLTNIFKRLKKQNDKTFNDMAKNMRKFSRLMMMTIVGVRNLFFLIRKIRTAFIDSFKQMSAQIPEVNEKTSEFLTSLQQVKGGLAVAFQPIAQVVLPLLSSLMRQLYAAMETLGKFFATLTGQGFIYKFTAATQDLGKSVGGAGKAAEEAKRTLMGFDELNLLNDDKDKGGGGGGGANDFGTFKKDTVEANSRLAELIKQAWAANDFTSVGVEIGTSIINGLRSIPWPSIKELAGNLGTDLATFLNGIIADIDGTNLFSEIGNTIAQGLNTVITFLYNFITTFNWGQFGKSLADGIMRFIKEVDWGKLGGTISGMIQGLLATISEFLLNIDFGEIIDAFIEFIYGVDWVGIGAALIVTLGSLAVAIIEGVGALLQAPFDAIAKGFELCGMDTIAGFFYGISDTLQKGVDTVVGFFKTYIIEPFKDLMGIHSPSTLFSELGGYLIEGLIEGIKGLIDKVVQIWTDLKSSTEEKFNAIKSKVVKIATNIKNNLTGKFGEVKTNVVDKFNALKTKVISVFNELKDNIKAPINAIIGFIESLVNGVINGINKMTSALNTLQIDIPSGPWGGGGSIGFNIPAIPTVSIPRLAQGGVIPPNQEFLAMLGDQKHGTNIEAPLDTIKQAVAEVLFEQIDALGDMTDAIIEAIQNKNLSVIIGDRDIGLAANRYNSRQNSLRGR